MSVEETVAQRDWQGALDRLRNAALATHASPREPGGEWEYAAFLGGGSA